MAQEASHRYWFTVHKPDLGLVCEHGWCFGADALAAATDALSELRKRQPKRAAWLTPGDVYVTHCGACSCLPPDMRRW